MTAPDVELTVVAAEEGTYVVGASFTDEDDAPAVPTSLWWTLTDRKGNVINNRLRVDLSPSASVDIVLSGDDLAVQTGETGEYVYRIVTVEGLYSSTLGSSLPLKAQAQLPIRNLLKVPTNEQLWYIDSVNGSDTNDGKSNGSPLKTLPALEAQSLQDGDILLFARNGHWRGMLDLGYLKNISLQSYGSGSLPILDASLQITNSSFVKTGGYTNVYQVSITPDWAGGGNDFLDAFEDDDFLYRATSLANCDSTPGTYYLSGEGAGTVTLYIHTTDSTSPITNTRRYEYTHYQTPLMSLNTENVTYRDLDLRRTLRTIGILHMGPNSTAIGCTFRQGNKLNLVLKRGCSAVNCASLSAYYGTDVSTLYDIFDVLANGHNVTITNCTADGTGNLPYTVGFGGHTDGVLQFGTVTITGCDVTNMGTAWGPSDIQTLVIEDNTFTQAWDNSACRGLSVKANVDAYQLTDTEITMVKGRAVGDSVGGGSIVSITDCVIEFTGTVNAAMVYSTQPTAFTVSGTTFTDSTPDTNTVFNLDNASVTLNVSQCIFNDPWGPYWLHLGIIAGVGLISDWNTFSESAMRFNIEDTNYYSVGDYVTGTGQDQNSTIL